MKTLQEFRSKLINLLDYNSDSGVFTWNVTKGSKAPKGSKAGNVNTDGYIRIRIDGKNYPAHRLAWLYVNGYWPSDEIDHINRVKTDNRLCNLRDVPKADNLRNKGRGYFFTYSSSNGWQARADFTGVCGKRVTKNFSCKRRGWLTAGKLAAKFVKENRPKQYQGAL